LFGGTFSGPFGLQIDPGTGGILPSGSVPGTYTVTFNPIGFCIEPSMDTIVIAECTPTTLLEKESLPFLVYPNPSTDRLRVELAAKHGDWALQLMDNQGRLVRSFVHTDDRWVEFSVAGLPAGIYLLHLQSERQSFAHRIEVRH
jgi:hypothetical protein